MQQPSAQDVEQLLDDAMCAFQTAEQGVQTAKERVRRILKAHLQSCVPSPEAAGLDDDALYAFSLLPGMLRPSPPPQPAPETQDEKTMMVAVCPVEEDAANPQSIVPSSPEQSTRRSQILEDDQVKKILSRRKDLRRFYTRDPGEQSRVQQIVASKWFDVFSILSITLSSAMIGWQTGRNANDLRRMAAEGNIISNFYVSDLVIDAILLLAYVIEVGLRAHADGRGKYFKGEDSPWNIFDIFLLIISSADTVTNIIVQAASPDAKSPISFLVALRVLRVLRMARSVRAIRTLQFFKDLRLMIASLSSCIKPLFWVGSVMASMFYVFGITFTEAAMSRLNTVEEWQSEGNQNLIKMFGSLNKSVSSLFQAMSGGDDWSGFYNALGKAGFLWQLLFLSYISINFFAVVNIVTGIFVQSALEMATNDKEALAFEQLKAREDLAKEFTEIFMAMDETGDEVIGLKELKEFMKHDRVQTRFAALGIHEHEVGSFFAIVDRDHNGELSLDEFLESVITMQGGGNFFNQTIIRNELAFVKDKLQELLIEVKENGSDGSNY